MMKLYQNSRHQEVQKEQAALSIRKSKGYDNKFTGQHYIVHEYLTLVTLLIIGALIVACGSTQTPSPTSLRVTPVVGSQTATPVPIVTPLSDTSATQEVPVSPTLELSPEPVEPYLGMWLTQEELATLPMSGVAWESLKIAAAQDPGEMDLGDQDQNHDVYILAKAFFYARTGEIYYRDEVIDNLILLTQREVKGDTLAPSRNLVAYVIAADLINLPEADPETDIIFRDWLRQMLVKSLDGRTLQSTNEERPNNWGTHAGASRAAIAIYLGDEEDLERTAVVFKGWMGDRDAYDGFEYGSLSWQADEDNPVGINPVGAVKEGHSIDGAQPEEMRRGGKFRWPPKETGYPWEALQGALVQAELLYRAGFNTWEWEDQALLRAVQFLYDIGWAPEGDDEWQSWLINYVYGTAFPIKTPVVPGKNMGWTDWTHSEHRPRP